ncbi:MAG: hypothetical protein R2713_09950 [Ilumatobacteraceae bacterium]
MKVRIPTPLRSYTAGAANVMADGSTVRGARRSRPAHPGIRFRMVDEQDRVRQHMVVFLDEHRCRDLDVPVATVGELVIMQALSGG